MPETISRACHRVSGSALPFSSTSPWRSNSIASPASRRVVVSTSTVAGRGRRLHPGCGVDRVTGDHRLTVGGKRGRDGAGDDTRARGESARPYPLTQRGDLGHQVHRGPDGSLCVSLDGHRRSPDGHHGVADELLDEAAVSPDHLAGKVEVLGQELADLLGVAALAERGEADQVDEHDRAQPAFGLGGRDAQRWARRRPRPPGSRTRRRTVDRSGPRRTRGRARRGWSHSLRRNAARAWSPRRSEGRSRRKSTHGGDLRHGRGSGGTDQSASNFLHQ